MKNQRCGVTYISDNIKIHLNVMLMMDNFMSLHNERFKLISAHKLNQQQLSNKEL